VHPRQNFLDAHLLSAVKGIGRIAPGAPQVAARQSHKDTRQTGARAFALDRFENFSDEHNGLMSGRMILRLLCSSRPFGPQPISGGEKNRASQEESKKTGEIPQKRDNKN